MKAEKKTDPAPKKASAFSELGLMATVAALCEEIRELYTADDVPWIIGYSGGKDSTATLQLIWMAIAELPVDQRKKPVHVISTDTMVENPVVAAWVANSLCVMKAAANEQAMPIMPRLLNPQLEESFWVNLIGRGYFLVASHQAVLLSTDEEIGGSYHQPIKSDKASEYPLAA